MFLRLSFAFVPSRIFRDFFMDYRISTKKNLGFVEKYLLLILLKFLKYWLLIFLKKTFWILKECLKRAHEGSFEGTVKKLPKESQKKGRKIPIRSCRRILGKSPEEIPEIMPSQKDFLKTSQKKYPKELQNKSLKMPEGAINNH